jgi:hypothetical protein
MSSSAAMVIEGPHAPAQRTQGKDGQETVTDGKQTSHIEPKKKKSLKPTDTTCESQIRMG